MRSYSLLLVLLTFGACAAQNTFTLRSADLGGQATLDQVFNSFGCAGANKSPQLAWTNAPVGTKSFAITMYDPDAPTGSGWWHWLVFDIPATVHELPTGAGSAPGQGMPATAVQSITDFGATGYSGPCPPPDDGLHQYIITVFALNTEQLGLDQKANAAMVGFNLNQHVLAKASLVFYYGR